MRDAEQLCRSVVPGKAARDRLHLVSGVPGERLRSGSAAVLGPDPTEDLSPGLLLRGHRDRHQPARSHPGGEGGRDIDRQTECVG